MMQNPYSGLPEHAFWRRAVSNIAPEDFDPIAQVPFAVARSDRVATAGSCFAQHISRTLRTDGFGFLETEAGPGCPAAANENYGVFSARYGNIYTVRQLLQLFQRAYGLFDPVDRVWLRPDGRFVDPFRPQIQACGFLTPEDVEADRVTHFIAVQAMFEQCDVFIFTLGLTESWSSHEDGAVFPLAPGVVASGGGPYRFENFAIEEMTSDFLRFARMAREVNPTLKFILTVSPVPLVATYEERHVLLSTIYSKSALRVAADIITKQLPGISYFPSYEIITGPQARGRFFGPDAREVTAEGVAYVMSLFRRHYLQLDSETKRDSPQSSITSNSGARQQELEILCDEESLDG